MKFFTMLLILGLFASPMFSQVPMLEVSACDLLGAKGLEKKSAREAKKLLQLKCELEKAKIRQELRDLKEEPKPAGSDAIGVASKNRSVTTVTTREVEVTPEGGIKTSAFEGSSGWARHTEKMADIDRRKTVGKAKAENPSCGWLGCYTPAVYGGGYGYYGGGNYYGGYGWGPGGAMVTSRGEAGVNIVYGFGR